MRIRSPSSKSSGKTSKKNTAWVLLFTLWIVFVLLSQVPFIAERLIDTSDMDETVESHLSFPADGRQGHYYVVRHDPNTTGRINVKYTTNSNSLEVECINIKILKIYCRDMYEEKSEDVFKRDPKLDSNYYKTYFIERDRFHVHVYTEQSITELSFIDTPIPYNVSVNSREWWLTCINYTYRNDGIVLTNVPKGHNYVDIHFKSNDKNSPIALFNATKTAAHVGETITFNASASYDPDGKIISYCWDMGDGTFKIGVITQHTYLEEGNYTVILEVKDDDYLINRSYKEITVIRGVMSISKSVDKLIATPMSILTYTITCEIDISWKDGVKDIVITDVLPEHLELVNATPIPHRTCEVLTWKFGVKYSSSELDVILLSARIKENVGNSTLIYNTATLDYKNITGQPFPQEASNSVNTKVNVGTLLAPQIRQPIPDINLFEDDPPYTLSLTAYEYDLRDSGIDLDWYITQKNDSLYIISGEYSDDDIITITPLPDVYGNSLVTLWLEDNDGFTANQPLWINIMPVNDKPTFCKAPDLTIHYAEPYTFNYEPYISDIDTPDEQLTLFAIQNAQGGGSIKDTRSGTQRAENYNDDSIPGSRAGADDPNIQVNGFEITYTFPENMVDTYIFVRLQIFDGYVSAGQTIQINITDDYTPKQIKDLPDVFMVEGETKLNVFDLDDYFEDPDDDSLFYSYGETNVKVNINADHTVDISAPSTWSGTDTITFRVQDPEGALAEDTIFVTVFPINDPPVITGVPESFVLHYEADYSFDLAPYISDEDNAIFELFLILDDDHIRVDPINHLKIILNYPKSMLGKEVPIILTVSDGLATGSQNVIVKVTNYWPPEVQDELINVEFYEDETIINVFNLNDYFSDKDSNTLYFSYGQRFVHITIKSSGEVDFTAKPNWNGVETVTFRATDPTLAFVENVITVTVIPVNDPPVIMPIPIINGMVNELYKFDLTNYIKDIDNDISDLNITLTPNPYVIVNGRELIIMSDEPVEECITITVSDGQAEANEEMIIQIKEVSSKQEGNNEIDGSILWVLILVIIIIISIMGYVAWRRIVGNYSIEDVFWIYKDGVLISHLSKVIRIDSADNELIDGIITKLSGFTKNAFSKDKIGVKISSTKEIRMKGKNIMLQRGRYSSLALIFSGKSGKNMCKNSKQILTSVEFKFGPVLKTWDGSMDGFEGSEKILKSMLFREPSKLEIKPTKTIKQPQIQTPIDEKTKRPRKIVRAVKKPEVQPPEVKTKIVRTRKTKIRKVKTRKIVTPIAQTRKVKTRKNKSPIATPIAKKVEKSPPGDQ